MTSESVKGLFQRAAEHATRYRDRGVDGLHRPAQNFAQSLAGFAEPVPERGAAAESVIDELAAKAEPGLHRMTGPRFLGWVIGGSHPAGVAADWLTAAWGQNSGNHHAAPAASAAEAVAMGWLLDILDLPRGSSVGFVTGATLASFVCFAAARNEVLRRVGWDVEAEGLFGAPPITVLIGDDAHTTVYSALQFLGLGHDRVVRVRTDDQGRIVPAAFRAACARIAGPAIAVLQAGQINTGAFDDFDDLTAAAHAAGAWVHVDGAFGLWARASPGLKPRTAGMELANSWATDGHKWLQTPYDCGYAIVRDADAHRRAMTIAASYLPPAAEGERDPSHFVPELSRRARGFATWAMIKHLGRDGIARMVEGHCAAARLIADRLRADTSIQILNDVVLNQVIVRFGAGETDVVGDRLTQDTIARIQSDGICFTGGAKWRGRQVMRISVINWQTDDAEAAVAAEAIEKAWEAVRGAA